MNLPWEFSDVLTRFAEFVGTDVITGGMAAMIALGLGGMAIALVRRGFMK